MPERNSNFSCSVTTHLSLFRLLSMFCVSGWLLMETILRFLDLLPRLSQPANPPYLIQPVMLSIAVRQLSFISHPTQSTCESCSYFHCRLAVAALSADHPVSRVVCCFISTASHSTLSIPPTRIHSSQPAQKTQAGRWHSHQKCLKSE